MKKIIVIALLCTLTFTPIMASAQVAQEQELRLQIISLIRQLIMVLQAQLDQMLAEQEQTAVEAPITQSETIESPTPTPTPTVQVPPKYVFEPLVIVTPSSIAFAIKDRYANCTLVILDSKGNMVRNQSTWSLDQDHHLRQVYDTNKGEIYEYEITCSKAGFEKGVVKNSVTVPR
ncbi:MAG: protein of unknown function DUF3138 [Siphoviridae sp. cttb18]|nr:MAG: protein of unknown function DUF3138 [Siphoviridae sp. cttb18]